VRTRECRTAVGLVRDSTDCIISHFRWAMSFSPTTLSFSPTTLLPLTHRAFACLTISSHRLPLPRNVSSLTPASSRSHRSPCIGISNTPSPRQPALARYHSSDKMTVPVSNTNGDAPVDILLIGLGSIGSVYAYILEKVSADVSCLAIVPSTFLPPCLPAFLPSYLPAFLPSCLPALLPYCLGCPCTQTAPATMDEADEMVCRPARRGLQL
jgi:hypothetical protein